MSTVPAPPKLRLAIDIGSGVTKWLVAQTTRKVVSSSSSHQSGGTATLHQSCKTEVVSEIALGEEKLPYGLIWKQHGQLTDEVCERGIACLRRIVNRYEDEIERGCYVVGGEQEKSICAIGTAVFRKASNGSAFLERVRQEVGIHVTIATQQQEALLGHATGLATLGLERRALLLQEQQDRSERSCQSGHANCGDLEHRFDVWKAGYSAVRPGPGSKYRIGSDESESTSPLQKGLPLPLSPILTDEGDGGHISKPLNVYDSGGGSFQIVSVSTSAGGGGDKVEQKEDIKMFLGEYGIAHATKDLLELLAAKRGGAGKTASADRGEVDLLNSDPYPISEAEAAEFLAVVKKNTRENCSLTKAIAGAPRLTQVGEGGSTSSETVFSGKGSHVLGIGGPDGIFRVAADLVAASRSRAATDVKMKYSCNKTPPPEEPRQMHDQASVFSYTGDELKNAIFEELVGGDKSAKSVTEKFLWFPNAEKGLYLLPKACSLLAVVELCGIERVHWRPVVGSCLGMLVLDEKELVL